MFAAGKISNQLPLAINLNDEATFSGFCWNGNEILREQLFGALSGNERQLFYLWGEEGSGKSHILQACCQYAGSSAKSAIYLPIKLLTECGHQILEGIEEHFLICLDDIDVIAGNKEFEEAIFHLYNKIRDIGLSVLIMTSKFAPNASQILLPDLRSRLAWGTAWHLKELADEDKAKTLQYLANKRGFNLSIPVCKYLLSRSTRNMHDLHALLNRLDEASLIAQRKITIPFVKTILQI